MPPGIQAPASFQKPNTLVANANYENDNHNKHHTMTQASKAEAMGNGHGILKSHKSPHNAEPSSSKAVVAPPPKFPILFRPLGSRAWEKSRRHDEEDTVPKREELDAQLRPEDEGLVPLNAVAGRVVHYAWQLFANQIEINSSLSPLQRRKRIYDDVHEARKQLIKLLVLTKWSQVAPELQVARSLIAFINDHFAQTDAAVASISETRGILSNARLRNYDLATAIEVLSSGGPQRVPRHLQDMIRSNRPYTDTEALDLVDELSETIRLKLASDEVMALPMMTYTIADGRACFSAKHLFEADLTLSGASPQDRWWLLRVRFNFNITGLGVDRFPCQPKGTQRLHLLALADAELAPISIAAANDSSVEEALETDQPSMFLESKSNHRKDAPLVRLYNLLQSQSLHYRLDILHWQATQLTSLSWGSRLSVHMDADRTLRILYWQNARSSVHSKWNPVGSAEIHISVQNVRCDHGAFPIIAGLFEQNDDRGHRPQRLSLRVDWVLNRTALLFIPNKNVQVDHQAIDAEALLRTVTKRHAEAAVRAFQERIEKSTLGSTVIVQSMQHTDGKTENLLCITLHDSLKVDLLVDAISGQVRLQESKNEAKKFPIAFTELAQSLRYKHIQSASSRLNEEPHNVVGILQRLRTQSLLDNLEQQSRLSGLACVTSMPLRQLDYAQLRATPGSVLFISIPQCATYYLAIHFAEDSIRTSIICVGTFLEEMTTSMRIVSLTRLDWRKALEQTIRPTLLGKRKREQQAESDHDAFTLTETDLSNLHSYSIALIHYQKIEQQLRERSVNCFFMRSTPSLESHSVQKVQSKIPSLCLRTESVLRASQKDILARNIVLQLRDWQDPLQCRVEFLLRLYLPNITIAPTKIVNGMDEIHFSTDGLLIFAIASVDNCLDRLLMLWGCVEKVLDLVIILSSRPTPAGSQAYKLESFDLMHVRFSYGQNLLARVGWIQDVSRQRGGYFSLEFGTEDGNVNPHAVMRDALQQELNRGFYSHRTFWHQFLALLHATLPVAKVIYKLPEQSLENADLPDMEVKSAFWVRLTFLERHALDVRLVRKNRILLHDAAALPSGLEGQKPTEVIREDEFSLRVVDHTKLESEKHLRNPQQRPIPKFEETATSLALSQANPLVFPNGLVCSWDFVSSEKLIAQSIDLISKSLNST